jgi:hypothetical protein
VQCVYTFEKKQDMNNALILITALSILPPSFLPVSQPEPSVTDFSNDSPFGAHFWVVTSSTVHPAIDIDRDGNPDTNLLTVVPDCELDDADRYQSDGTILTDYGKHTCDEEQEPQAESGIWSYDPGSKMLTMEKYDGGGPIQAILESASGSELVFVSELNSSKGSHTIRTTLKIKKM